MPLSPPKAQVRAVRRTNGTNGAGAAPDENKPNSVCNPGARPVICQVESATPRLTVTAGGTRDTRTEEHMADDRQSTPVNPGRHPARGGADRKSTRLNSRHTDRY